MKYYPQGLIEVNKSMKRYKNKVDGAIGNRPSREGEYTKKYENYPNNILNFDLESKGVHPTQKPVTLFEYLIKTYTNENEIVLDNCLGSGTTAVACELNNRKWIGFETEPKYIEIINKRLDQIQLDNDLKDYE